MLDELVKTATLFEEEAPHLQGHIRCPSEPSVRKSFGLLEAKLAERKVKSRARRRTMRRERDANKLERTFFEGGKSGHVAADCEHRAQGVMLVVE